MAKQLIYRSIFLFGAVLEAIGCSRPATESTHNNQAALARCTQNLHAIYFCIDEYSQFNKDRLPRTLNDALDAHGANESEFYHISNDDRTPQYFMIDWSEYFHLSEFRAMHLPICYDSSLRNHLPEIGVNILWSDGSVGFDVNCVQIDAAREKHPKLFVPRPTP